MSEVYTIEFLNRQFKPLVAAARRKGINPKNVDRFVEFLKNSRDDRLNWAYGMVRHFAGWAGEEYEGFVDDVSPGGLYT
jgi:hypothetical protein